MSLLCWRSLVQRLEGSYRVKTVCVWVLLSFKSEQVKVIFVLWWTVADLFTSSFLPHKLISIYWWLRVRLTTSSIFVLPTGRLRSNNLREGLAHWAFWIQERLRKYLNIWLAMNQNCFGRVLGKILATFLTKIFLTFFVLQSRSP